jgi:hypothetical protein
MTRDIDKYQEETISDATSVAVSIVHEWNPFIETFC